MPAAASPDRMTLLRGYGGVSTEKAETDVAGDDY
jgi:hypothetical protein